MKKVIFILMTFTFVMSCTTTEAPDDVVSDLKMEELSQEERNNLFELRYHKQSDQWYPALKTHSIKESESHFLEKGVDCWEECTVICPPPLVCYLYEVNANCYEICVDKERSIEQAPIEENSFYVWAKSTGGKLVCRTPIGSGWAFSSGLFGVWTPENGLQYMLEEDVDAWCIEHRE